MAGKKTTTVTNVFRMNATDAKRFMRLCGQPVAESDKLHIMNYDIYGIDSAGVISNISGLYSRFALIPNWVNVEQAATAYTASDARELALLNRLIDAGIASSEEIDRYNALTAKASGSTTMCNYTANNVDGHSIDEVDEVGRLLTTLTLS